MRTLVAGTVVGLTAFVGGVLGYQHTAPAAAQQTATAQAAPVRAHHHRVTRVVVRYRPCPKGDRLQAGVCVRQVQHTVTVTVTAPAPAAPAPAVAAPPAPRPHVGSSGSAGYHDDGGGHGDDGGGTHGDDGGGHGGGHGDGAGGD